MTKLIIMEGKKEVTLDVDVSIKETELKNKPFSKEKKCGLGYVTECIKSGKLIYDRAITTESLGVILKEYGEKYGKEVGGPADNLMQAYMKYYIDQTNGNIKNKNDAAKFYNDNNLVAGNVDYLKGEYEKGVGEYNKKHLENKQGRLSLDEKRIKTQQINNDLTNSPLFQKQQQQNSRV